MPQDPGTAVDREALRRVRALRGVLRADFVTDRDREEIRGLSTPDSAENRGVDEVLQCSRVLCLFKDASFRAPPEPTLLLVDDAGGVLGRELVAGEMSPKERKLAHLGKDFVLFPGARPHGRLRFLLPPVGFPELEDVPGITRVVSASPDTPQDDYLRDCLGAPHGREYASVLVGYNVRNP